MKRSELVFGAALVPIDFIALLLAASAAYALRTSRYVQQLRPAVFELDLPFLEYLQLAVAVSGLIVIIFALQGLYSIQVTRRPLDEATRIFSGISMGMMAMIVMMFLQAELFQSRFILLAAYGLGVLFVACGRWLVHRLQVFLLRRGVGVHRVVLVGNGRFADQLAQVYAREPHLGFRVVATLPSVQREALERILRTRGIDEVIKTDQTLPAEDNLQLLDFCDTYKLTYRYVPDLFETYAANIRFTQVRGVPLMELQRTPLDGWGRIAKRVIDVAGSAAGLLVLSPLFLLAALLIRLDSPGPIFYRQTRVGRNTQPFEIFKFRSMKAEYCLGERYGGSAAAAYEETLRLKANERSGPLFKMRRDPRVTRFGRLLRKTRIDELPQLLNVFRGEMSLIGPRPHLPHEVALYSKHHHKLFTIKPGMTGMAQVQGNAGLSFEQEAKLDIGYIEDWS
ncbi:MAG: hypothetical protein COT71_03495, partial [Candidatus Andersenbacteria bacterium CG10_big_fil_rev_8_21_14_0_10_54_11]